MFHLSKVIGTISVVNEKNNSVNNQQQNELVKVQL